MRLSVGAEALASVSPVTTAGCAIVGGETIVVELQGILEAGQEGKTGMHIGTLDLANMVRGGLCCTHRARLTAYRHRTSRR